LTNWFEINGIELAYIQKGKPQQNGYTERLNGPMRREFLDACLFESPGDRPPSMYQKLENSNLQLTQ
jgi:putative transposase